MLTFWEPGIPDIGCDLLLDFHHKLLVRTLVPTSLLVALGLLNAGLKQWSSVSETTGTRSRQLKRFSGNAAFVIIFVCYTGCSTAVFSTFSCDTFDNKQRYLKADYSIDCDSPTHSAYESLAYALLVWPIGTPLLYAWLFFCRTGHANIRNSTHFAPARQLRRRRSAISTVNEAPGPLGDQARQTTRHLVLFSSVDQELMEAAPGNAEKRPDLATRAFGAAFGELGEQVGADADKLAVSAEIVQEAPSRVAMQLPGPVLHLVSAYERDFYWWEIVECVRKLLLGGVLVFYKQGSLDQLVLGMFFAVTSIMVYNYFKPYESPTNDLLQALCQFSVFVVLLSAIIDKFDASQRASTTMTFILFCCTLIPPLVAIAMKLVEEIKSEHWRAFESSLDRLAGLRRQMFAIDVRKHVWWHSSSAPTRTRAMAAGTTTTEASAELTC